MFLAVKEIQVIHCICSKVIDDKHRQAVCSAVSGYFAVNILFFCHYCIPFRSWSRPVFNGSGSGSGSEQTVSTAPAPAPAPTKMCRLRRLRLRLRLRLRIPASRSSAGLDWIRISGSWIWTGLDLFHSIHFILWYFYNAPHWGGGLFRVPL